MFCLLLSKVVSPTAFNYHQRSVGCSWAKISRDNHLHVTEGERYPVSCDVPLSDKTVGKEEQRVLWYWSFEAILHDLRPNFQGNGQTSAWQWEVVNNSSFLLYFHVQLFLFSEKEKCLYLRQWAFPPYFLLLSCWGEVREQQRGTLVVIHDKVLL